MLCFLTRSISGTLKMLRAKFRFQDDIQRSTGKKEKGTLLTVHISPLGILTF